MRRSSIEVQSVLEISRALNFRRKCFCSVCRVCVCVCIHMAESVQLFFAFKNAAQNQTLPGIPWCVELLVCTVRVGSSVHCLPRLSPNAGEQAPRAELILLPSTRSAHREKPTHTHISRSPRTSGSEGEWQKPRGRRTILSFHIFAILHFLFSLASLSCAA